MKKQPSLLGGASIITGVCVGAGMLGLPMSGAGAWTGWTLAAITFTMITMTLSGWLLLEVYQDHPIRASFNTVTQAVLGKHINIINNLAVYFVGGILLYAYITASGDILQNLAKPYLDLGNASGRIWSVIFVAIFSFFVWHSTRLVDRISVVLISFMAISFCLSISGLISHIDLNILWDLSNENGEYAKYSLAVLPIALTSFGYHHSVSSMRAYYGEERKAKWAIMGGLLLHWYFICSGLSAFLAYYRVRISPQFWQVMAI